MVVVLCCAVLCCVVLCCVVLCCVVLCCVVLCCVVLCCVVLCCVVLCCVVLCCVVLCCVVLCCVVLCCVVLCCVVLCCVVLCCVVLCCVVLCCVVLCCVVLCCAVLRCVVLCCVVLCCVVSYCVVLCCVVLCCVVLCCVVLCCVVLCCVVLCCVVLCCIVLCCVVLCCGVLCCDFRMCTIVALERTMYAVLVHRCERIVVGESGTVAHLPIKSAAAPCGIHFPLMPAAFTFSHSHTMVYRVHSTTHDVEKSNTRPGGAGSPRFTHRLLTAHQLCAGADSCQSPAHRLGCPPTAAVPHQPPMPVPQRPSDVCVYVCMCGTCTEPAIGINAAQDQNTKCNTGAANTGPGGG